MEVYTGSKVVSCDGERNFYDINIVIEQELTSCKDADYFDLYQRALRTADFGADDVTCKGGCDRTSGEIYRTWSYAPIPGETPGAKARCEVVKRVFLRRHLRRP